MQAQPFIMTVLWVIGILEPSEGPWAIAKGKEGVTSFFLVICVPSRSYMGQ